eukprot:scaffold5480_cov111-Isochrysis_galbana.AAC.4
MPSASSSGAPGRLARNQRSSALAASSSFQAAWSRSAKGTPRKRMDGGGGPLPNIGGSAFGNAPEGGEAPTVTNPRMQSTRMRLSREKAEAMQPSQAACSRGAEGAKPGHPLGTLGRCGLPPSVDLGDGLAQRRWRFGRSSTVASRVEGSCRLSKVLLDVLDGGREEISGRDGLSRGLLAERSGRPGASTSGVMPSLPASARRSARARFQMASRATMSLMAASAAQRAAASAGNISWMAASEAP